MKSFKEFTLQENINIENLDIEFLNRAERVTSLNLVTSDFTSLKRKKEIQYLFKKHFFPSLDISETLDNETVEAEKFNLFVSKLQNISAEKFQALYNYNLKGVGPGEVLLYFVYNKCRLGGGTSAGEDIIFLGSRAYEVKASVLTKEGFLKDFKLGGTFSLNKVENALFALAEKEGFDKAEISSSKIDLLKNKYPKEFSELEKQYAEITYNSYFKNHDIIFFNNTPTLKNRGKIISVKNVKQNEIFIERFTSKTLKPLIKA